MPRKMPEAGERPLSRYDSPGWQEVGQALPPAKQKMELFPLQQ
jgi:hypothetical protein